MCKRLDAAGALPLSGHGSTTAAILAAAEASAAAHSIDAIVLTDDFGDQLDAASGEYLAACLRRGSGQLWLSTRQPEVPRAFEATELLRLTRSSGRRKSFQLREDPDRKERMRRRHLFTLLGPAMSARTVVLLEGPHDMETYTTVSRRLFAEHNEPPLSAFGMRLVPASASGGEGGKQELPKIAKLAADLGLAVRVVLDHDKNGTDNELVDELRAVAEMVVRLPKRAAVERAIVDPRQLHRRWRSGGKMCLGAQTEERSACAVHRCAPQRHHATARPAVIKQLKTNAPSDPLITLHSP